MLVNLIACICRVNKKKNTKTTLYKNYGEKIREIVEIRFANWNSYVTHCILIENNTQLNKKYEHKIELQIRSVQYFKCKQELNKNLIKIDWNISTQINKMFRNFAVSLHGSFCGNWFSIAFIASWLWVNVFQKELNMFRHTNTLLYKEWNG